MKRTNSLTLIKMFRSYRKKVPISFLLYAYKTFRNERPHWFNDQVRINSGIPPYPSKAFDRFMDILVNQKRIPHTINFAITSKCPYRCPHCLYGKRMGKDLSTNEILDLIKDMKDLGASILGITGGEPMSRLDLEKIISATKPELATIVYTTGYNLNKKRAEKLYKAGLDWITIGIESTDADFQDKIRGEKGSLQTGIKAIKNCQEAGIYTAIGTIGTREKITSGELYKIYNFANYHNVQEMRLVPPSATGRWEGHTDEILLSNELEFHKKFHIEHNKKRSGPIVTSLAYLESREMFGCFAGYNYLYLDSSGEVCPCDLMPFSFGNIKNISLKELWMKMEKNFPNPRPSCIMRELSPRITSDTYPLSLNESKKIIPPYRKNTELPKIYDKIRKTNN